MYYYEVERIALRDNEGRIRIEFGVEDGQDIFGSMYQYPVIRLFDEAGEWVVKISVNRSGSPTLCLRKDDASLGLHPWSASISTTDLEILRMTAEQNCGGYALTKKLNKLGLIANWSDEWYVDTGSYYMDVYANTETQPQWNYHLGLGRFSISDREVTAAYQEAGASVFNSIVRNYFPWIEAERVRLLFYIYGYPIGIWLNGVMKLAGE